MKTYKKKTTNKCQAFHATHEEVEDGEEWENHEVQGEKGNEEKRNMSKEVK